MSALKICPTCGAEYPANERFCPRDGTALRTQGAAGADLVGSIIAERYHVIRKLGEGGMGTVYLAEHVKMGRKSAVKVMNPGMGQDADAISRFNREASNASRINHPHVAGIYDFGETPDGLIYLAMEYVEGEPLSEVVAARGALPPERAAEITRQAAEALSAAHDLGIVHRDLKPDNIMIAKNRDGSDCVKVVDFGIAKAANNDVQKVTKTGLVVGTPEYMSPEQLSGGRLDGRSDVYSLALVAFHMLSGGLPFPGETAQEAMIMRLTERPKTLAETKPDMAWTPRLQAVMDRALERDAAARFQTAAEFGSALMEAVGELPTSAEGSAGTLVMEGAAATTGVPATRVSPSGPANRQPDPEPVKRGGRTPMLVGGGVAVALLLGGAVYAARNGASPVANRDSGAPATSGAAGAPDSTVPPASPLSASLGAAPRPVGSVSERAPATPPAAAPRISYAGQLQKLWESVTDPASARQALKGLETYRSKALTRGDSAVVALIAGKAELFTGGAKRGCPILRRIDPAALRGDMKAELLEGLQTCEGS